MNEKKLLSLLAALSALSAYAADQEVKVSNLPVAVRRTLESARAGSPVKQVIHRTVDGRSVYVAEIDKNNALNPHIQIAEDGSLLPPPDIGAAPMFNGNPVLDPGRRNRRPGVSETAPEGLAGSGAENRARRSPRP